MKLYDYAPSGNGYKVRLLLAHLGLPYERIEVDSNAGETRTPAFLEMNANAKIPTVVLDDGTVLPESNAILYYFAEGTPYLPDKRIDRAQALRWMFFEQYSHEPYIAVLRNWLHHPDSITPEQQARVPDLPRRGAHALEVMERQLAAEPYFAAGRYTIADIALYAYTHVAGEGGFDLKKYPAILAWIGRVEAQPGHVPLDRV
ncbi:MAG: glutathione S-transferase family protein [Alphaproteobacteria bacterium]|nr:glutathione S-transferase family protein [Alphaproteobacteria bacterium]